MDEGWTVVAVFIIAIVMAMLSAVVERRLVAMDCDALHAFKVGDDVYDCRKRGADDR